MNIYQRHIFPGQCILPGQRIFPGPAAFLGQHAILSRRTFLSRHAILSRHTVLYTQTLSIRVPGHGPAFRFVPVPQAFNPPTFPNSETTVRLQCHNHIFRSSIPVPHTAAIAYACSQHTYDNHCQFYYFERCKFHLGRYPSFQRAPSQPDTPILSETPCKYKR